MKLIKGTPAIESVFALFLFLILTAASVAQKANNAMDVVKSDTALTGSAPAISQSNEAERAHYDAHDVSHFTPQEEMMKILEHKVENSPYIHEYPFPQINLPTNWVVNVAGLPINMSPSRHVVYLWFGMLLTIWLVWLAGRQNARNSVPKGYGNMIESLVVFIRDEVAIPFLGKDSKKYLTLLLTFFFFITIVNLVGLLPFSATSTGNIGVTAGLALITFSFMIFGGMKANGALGFWKGLIPHGVPVPLLPLMFLIEVMGLLTKPFALAIRLFANMLSGGLVIGAFYALIFGMDTLAIAPLSIFFLLFMSLLKIFVCFLQAYIFTMLSSFFIGMSLHQSH